MTRQRNRALTFVPVMAPFTLCFLLFFAVVVLASAALAPAVLAYDLPQVRILSLEDTAAADGTSVGGILQVRNYEDSAIAGITLKAQLYADMKDGIPMTLIDEQSLDTFGIAAKTGVPLAFSYALPAGIGGDYTLRLTLVNAQGNALSWRDAPVHAGGTPRLVLLRDSMVTFEGERYNAEVGVPFAAGASVPVLFRAYNPGPSQQFTPHIAIHARQADGPVVSESDLASVQIGAGESEQTVLLSAPANPGVYVAVIIYTQAGVQASSIAPVRFVVEGEAATIWQLSVDRERYTQGQLAIANAVITGPPDGSDAGDVTLIVTMTDPASGAEVGRAQTTVPLLLQSDIKLTLQVNADVKNPVVTAVIVKDGNELARHRVEYKDVRGISTPKAPPAEQGNAQPVTTVTTTYTIPIIVVVTLVFLLALLVGWLYYRKKVNRKNAATAQLVLLLVSAVFLVAVVSQPVLAFNKTRDCSFRGALQCCCPEGAIEHCGACPASTAAAVGLGDVGLTWNLPVQWEDASYENGFVYDGGTSIAPCQNGLWPSVHHYYLADLDGNPVKEFGTQTLTTPTAHLQYHYPVNGTLLEGIPPGPYRAYMEATATHHLRTVGGVIGGHRIAGYELICVGSLDYCKEACIQKGYDWNDAASVGHQCCGNDKGQGQDFLMADGGALCVKTTQKWTWVGQKTGGTIFRLDFTDGNYSYRKGEAVNTDQGPLLCGPLHHGSVGTPKPLDYAMLTTVDDESYDAGTPEYHGYLCTPRGDMENKSWPILECPSTGGAINTDPSPTLVGAERASDVGDYRRVALIGDNFTAARDGRTFWCATNGSWRPTMDNDIEACTVAGDRLRLPGGGRLMTWTGSRCCGEEGAEFYSDKTLILPDAKKPSYFGDGCFAGKVVKGAGKVMRTTSEVFSREWLVVNGSMAQNSIVNINGTFHSCKTTIDKVLPKRAIGIVRQCAYQPIENRCGACFCVQSTISPNTAVQGSPAAIAGAGEAGECKVIEPFEGIGALSGHLIAYDAAAASCGECACSVKLSQPVILY